MNATRKIRNVTAVGAAAIVTIGLLTAPAFADKGGRGGDGRPEDSTPSVSIPSVPSVSVPSVSIPSVSIPSVSIPSVSIPSVSVPSSVSPSTTPNTTIEDRGAVRDDNARDRGHRRGRGRH